jgi:hypothetical protein
VAAAFEVIAVVDDGLRQPVKAPTIIRKPAIINSFFFIIVTPYIIFRGSFRPLAILFVNVTL